MTTNEVKSLRISDKLCVYCTSDVCVILKMYCSSECVISYHLGHHHTPQAVLCGLGSEQ